MRSSVMPSAKRSCLASPPILVNGSTAIEGLSGSGKDAVAADGDRLRRNRRRAAVQPEADGDDGADRHKSHGRCRERCCDGLVGMAW